MTYGVLPPHLRMPWIALLSFGYLGVLSFTRGGDERIIAERIIAAAGENPRVELEASR